MKSLSISTWLFGLLLFQATLNPLVWAHSPHDFVRAVAVSPDYLNDHTVFCSLTHMDDLILKSTDNGSTWVPSQIGFPHYAVTCIRISPGFANDGILYTGTIKGGVFRSTNRGRTWSSSNFGLTSLKINRMALSPDFSVDQTLFVATDGKGIFKSTNKGASWQKRNNGMTNLTANDITVSPAFATDKTLFCATDGGVFKSTDAGLTWFASNGGIPDGTKVMSIACSPDFAQDQIVVAGTWGKGVVKSRTGGGSWRRKNTGIDEFDIVVVAFSPDFATDHTVIAASQDFIYKSVDRCNIWNPATAGLMDKVPYQTETHYFAIGFSPGYTQDQTLFLGAWEGLHVSHNAAENWTQLNVYNQNFIRSMTISSGFADDGVVFAGAYGGGVYKSTNYGATWAARSTGVTSMHIASLQASPDYPQDQTVFAGIHPDVIKTTVGGLAWYDLEVDPVNYLYARSIVISPDFEADQTLFSGNDRNGIYKVYKTRDSGTTFTGYTGGFKVSYCFAISPDFAKDGILYTGSESGIFASEDGGETWSYLAFYDKKIFSLAISPEFSTDGVIFAGVANCGLFKSSNRGVSWRLIDLGPIGPIVQNLIISPAFGLDRTVFSMTKSHGVFKSTDGGDTWSYSGLWGKLLKSGVISPEYLTDQTLFIGGWGRICKTTNGGDTWQSTLTIQRFDDSNEFVIYEGPWRKTEESLASGKTLMMTGVPSATANLTFHGNGVSWVGVRTHAAGIAQVFIDDIYQGNVDLYAATTEMEALLFVHKNLSYGDHTITIMVTGDKNPRSLGTNVVIDAFDIRY